MLLYIHTSGFCAFAFSLVALAAAAVYKQLDASSSGREEAFRATLDSQWALLVSQEVEAEGEARQSSLSPRREGDGRSDDGGTETSASGKTGSPTRSPFLVCGDRHPDAILALESVAHRARTQLAYSRGDTACLLAGLRLNEVKTLRQSEGVHAVEPLPQPAKLSRNLHARLDGPLESSAGGVTIDGRSEGKANGGGSEGKATGGGSHAQQEKQQQQHGAPRNIRFNHGEGLPDDLDVSLTPGTWGLHIVRAWTEHLASFSSTSHLWEEHLRDRFLWTHRPGAHADEAEAAAAAADQSGEKAENDEGKERRRLAEERARPSATRARNPLVAAHGLEDLEALWNQAADRSDDDGACDFQRLRASPPASEPTPQENGTGPDAQGLRGNIMNPRRRQVGRRRDGRPGPSQKDSSASSTKGAGIGGDGHDRVVLRGAGALGKSPQDDAHCLLTVLAYLATRPEVAYLDELPPVFALNVEAAWITQSGEETTYSTWNQGIDGRTEVRDAASAVRRVRGATLAFSGGIFHRVSSRFVLPWTPWYLFLARNANVVVLGSVASMAEGGITDN